MDVEVVDPWVDPAGSRECELIIKSSIPVDAKYGAVVVAVAHHQFVELNTLQWRQMLISNGVVVDLKGIVPRELGPVRM